MSIPVFDDVEPPPACGCEGCARRRLAESAARSLAADTGGPPTTGAPRLLVLAAAAGTALGGAAGGAAAAAAAPAVSAPASPAPVTSSAPSPAPVAAVPVTPAPVASSSVAPVPLASAIAAPEPVASVTAAPVPAASVATATASASAPAAATGSTTGQAVLAGVDDLPTAGPLWLTRAQILDRAKTWVAARVPYSMTAHWKDGYRQDCSGFVSMAWGLGTSAWTGDLARYGVRITREQLGPGDILLFHNPADPLKGSHTLIFGGWADAAHTRYTGYEQTGHGARTRSTPYAYWTHSGKYLPYRYKYLAGSGRSGSGGGAPAGGRIRPYPGPGAFRPGRSSDDVLALGRRLVARGFGAHYRIGPTRTWHEADRRNVEAFQRAQGWAGRDADGYPGPETWRRLFS